MRRTLSLSAAAASALVLAAVAAGAGSRSEADPIVIGAAIAKTGNMQAYDLPAYAAFELRVREINKAGGILGRKIKLVTADTRSDPARGKAAAERVMDQGAEIVLATCDFDFGSPAALAAEDAGKVSFSLCAQSPKWGVQGIGPHAYTAAIATFSEGSVLANFATKKGWKNGFVLVDDLITYDREVCDGFKQSWKGGVAGEATFKSGDASIASQITKIKQAKPGFLVFCSFPPGGPTALRQIRAAGIDIPVISGNAMDGTYWTKSVPGLKDFYVSATVSIFGDDPNPKVNQVVAAFKKTTGGPPAVGLAFAGYSAMEALELALRRNGANTDGDTLAKALDGIRNAKLLVGRTSFSPDLHINKDRPMAVLQFVNGKPHYVGTYPSDTSVDLGIAG